MQNDDIQLRGSRYSALACQYLYNSSVLFSKALEKYNNAVHGEIESALSDFHKAWDALWQADKIVNNNGFMTRGEAKEFFFLMEVDACIDQIDFTGLSIPIPDRNVTNYIKFLEKEKVQEAIIDRGFIVPKKPKYDDFISSLTDLINGLERRNKKELFTQEISDNGACCGGYCEHIATPAEKTNGYVTKTWYKNENLNMSGTTDTYSKFDNHGNRTYVLQTNIPKVVPGWNSELSSDIFKELCNYNSPLFFNLKLFTLFRNSAQHDYIELAQGSYDSLIQLLNPYVSALIINYLEGYKQVYKLVLQTCGPKSKRASYCAFDYLQNVNTLKNIVRLPFTYTYLTNTLNSYLEPSRIPSRIEHKYKTVRKLITETTREVEGMMNNDYLTFEEIETIKMHPRYQISLIKNDTETINPTSFPYKNRTEVAKAVEKSTGKKITGIQVQNILEKLFKAYPEERTQYKRTIWESTRYSVKAVSYVSQYVTEE